MQIVSDFSAISAQRTRALLGVRTLSIFDVPGASLVAISPNPDWGPIFQAAMLTGNKYFVPPGDYVFRTRARVVTSKSVFLEMAPGAVIVQHEDMLGQSVALIEIEGAVAPADGGRVSCVLTNMTFSQQRATNYANRDPQNRFAVFSEDSNIEGTKCLDLAKLYKPIVEGGYFFGGRTSPNSVNPLGFGTGDTGIDIHGCVDGVVKDALFEGFYDLGVYDNGAQWRTNLTNSFSCTLGSTEIKVAFSNHGKVVGEAFSITGTTVASGNVNLLNKGFKVKRVESSSVFVFDYTEAADNTAASWGGAHAIWSYLNQIEGMEGGEGLLVDNCTFLWCGNALSSKRGAIGTTVRQCHARYVGNGFRSSIVAGPTGGSHFNLIDTVVKWCQGVPFEVHGPNCTVVNCRAVNFAKNFVLDASGTLTGSNGYQGRSANNPSPISGLNALSAVGLKVLGFTAVQEGSWKAGVDAEPSRTPCGVYLGNHPMYGYGTTGAYVTGLRTDGVNRPFEEFPTRSANNTVGAITAENYTKDSIIQTHARQSVYKQEGRVDLSGLEHLRPGTLNTIAGSSVAGWSSRASSNLARMHGTFENSTGVAGGVGTEYGGWGLYWGASMTRYLYLNANGLALSKPITFTPTAASAAPNSSVFLDSSNDHLSYKDDTGEVRILGRKEATGTP